MRKAGVDVRVIMAIFEHKTMPMFKRYNQIDLDDGRDAVRKLEAYLAARKIKEEIIDFNLTSNLQNVTAAFA